MVALKRNPDVTADQRSGVASITTAIRPALCIAISIGAAPRMKKKPVSPSATGLVTGMSRFRRSVTDILSPPPPVEAMGKIERSCLILSMRTA